MRYAARACISHPGSATRAGRWFFRATYVAYPTRSLSIAYRADLDTHLVVRLTSGKSASCRIHLFSTQF